MSLGRWFQEERTGVWMGEICRVASRAMVPGRTGILR
jgi:hypothetical protein